MFRKINVNCACTHFVKKLSKYSFSYSEDRMTEGGETNEDSNLINDEASGGILGQIFNCGRFSHPTKTSENIVAVEICLYCE